MAQPEDSRARFEALVYPDPNSGCFIYAGFTKPDGYGFFYHDRRHWQAHRFAWVLAFGEIPYPLWVLHKCDVRCCVNPDHLYLGTQMENMGDMARRRRGTTGRLLPYGVGRGGRGGFRAHIAWRGRDLYLGNYRTPEEAHRRAVEEFERLHGVPWRPSPDPSTRAE
jgi:hypothetical protein